VSRTVRSELNWFRLVVAVQLVCFLVGWLHHIRCQLRFAGRPTQSRISHRGSTADSHGPAGFLICMHSYDVFSHTVMVARLCAQVHMLSGDTPAAAKHIAVEVAIDEKNVVGAAKVNYICCGFCCNRLRVSIPFVVPHSNSLRTSSPRSSFCNRRDTASCLWATV
jgi:hypothetical protein